MKCFLLRIAFFILPILAMNIIGCRGWTTDKPPVHLNPNMDTQEKYKAYREVDWFADGRTMRPIIEGTVARGFLKEDSHFYRGMVDGKFAQTYPKSLKIDLAFLENGRKFYEITCRACHDSTGSGKGLVGIRMLVRPTSLHSDRLRKMSVGNLFKVISEGERNMSGYKTQISENDRWAIISYVRALQLSQDPRGSWLSAGVKE